MSVSVSESWLRIAFQKLLRLGLGPTLYVEWLEAAFRETDGLVLLK